MGFGNRWGWGFRFHILKESLIGRKVQMQRIINSNNKSENKSENKSDSRSDNSNYSSSSN